MKKLSLNKETLIRLQDAQMSTLIGAAGRMTNDDSAGVCISNNEKGEKACDVNVFKKKKIKVADNSCCKKSCKR